MIPAGVRESKAAMTSHRRLIGEANMLLSAIASHGPDALTSGEGPDYVPGLIRRLRDALEKANGPASEAPNITVDIDGMATSLLEKSHEPSFADNAAGAIEALSYARHLIDTYVEGIVPMEVHCDGRCMRACEVGLPGEDIAVRDPRCSKHGKDADTQQIPNSWLLADAAEARREHLAEVIHDGLFGFDDWGAANADERAEMLEYADTILAHLHGVLPAQRILDTEESVLAAAKVIHDWALGEGEWDHSDSPVAARLRQDYITLARDVLAAITKA